MCAETSWGETHSGGAPSSLGEESDSLAALDGAALSLPFSVENGDDSLQYFTKKKVKKSECGRSTEEHGVPFQIYGNEHTGSDVNSLCHQQEG